MPRYISDQNKVVFQYESGLYANPSGAASTAQWIGEVMDHSVSDDEALIEDRFIGAATRSVNDYRGGPRTVEGTLSYAAQDMRFMLWAIGSVNEGATVGGNAHYANQVETGATQNPFVSGTLQLNPPKSFTIEDSKSNNIERLVRTIKGCVINNATLSVAQGEKAMIDIEYIAQNLALSSGTAPLGVTKLSNTPYLWSHTTVTVSGTPITTAKEVSLSISNNIEGPHYLNGSRDISAPILGNRENTLSITMDLDGRNGNLLYDLYKQNAVFNSVLDLNADIASTGSQHTIFTMSGCLIKSMDMPSVVEGVCEGTVEIVCPTIIGSAIDGVSKYNPW